MSRVVGELDEHGVERLDQHVDGKGGGHGSKAKREAGERIASDGQIGDAGERDQDQIAGIGGDAGDDADEGQDIGQRPVRRYDDELADQRGDQAGFLRHAGADHRGDHEPDRGEAHEVRDQRRVHEADAVGVQQAADLGGRGLDLVRVRVDAFVGDGRSEQAEQGGEHDDDGDEDQENDHGMGNHVPHSFDTVEKPLHGGLRRGFRAARHD